MTALALRPGRRAAISEFGAAVRTIMVKELRSRFRGRRAFVVLTIYLGLLALLAYATYAVISPSARENATFGGSPNASATIGIAVFTVLSFFQLLLVCFIAPAFTTGAISLEREKQTLDLLVSTPLRPGAIVVGKLLAALAYVGLMILAAIPISAIVFMYGGATVDDIVRQQLVLLVTALGLGAIGLFWSALIKRTQAATVLTYCTMLALTVGTVLLWVFWTLFIARNVGLQTSQRAPEQILWVNPGVARVDVVAGTDPAGSGSWSNILAEITGVGSPVNSATGGFTCQGDNVKQVCFTVDQFGNTVGNPFSCPANAACVPPDAAVVGTGQPTTIVGHFLTRFAISFGIVALIATFFSMRLVVPAGMRFVFRRASKGRAAVGPQQPVPQPAVADGDPEIAAVEESG
jgi:ABC-type transport system involved in multi-copper enzyme maturation permease subunit